jgi:hypothetical protein
MISQQYTKTVYSLISILAPIFCPLCDVEPSLGHAQRTILHRQMNSFSVHEAMYICRRNHSIPSSRVIATSENKRNLAAHENTDRITNLSGSGHKTNTTFSRHNEFTLFVDLGNVLKVIMSEILP